MLCLVRPRRPRRVALVCPRLGRRGSKCHIVSRQTRGAVVISSAARKPSACSLDPLHISSVGRKLTQTAGRSGLLKRAQLWSGRSCTQEIPAGFPRGMPGIGDDIEGAIQHAPHCGRHSISALRIILPPPQAPSGAGSDSVCTVIASPAPPGSLSSIGLAKEDGDSGLQRQGILIWRCNPLPFS